MGDRGTGAEIGFRPTFIEQRTPVQEHLQCADRHRAHAHFLGQFGLRERLDFFVRRQHEQRPALRLQHEVALIAAKTSVSGCRQYERQAHLNHIRFAVRFHKKDSPMPLGAPSSGLDATNKRSWANDEPARSSKRTKFEDEAAPAPARSDPLDVAHLPAFVAQLEELGAALRGQARGPGMFDAVLRSLGELIDQARAAVQSGEPLGMTRSELESKIEQMHTSVGALFKRGVEEMARAYLAALESGLTQAPSRYDPALEPINEVFARARRCLLADQALSGERAIPIIRSLRSAVGQLRGELHLLQAGQRKNLPAADVFSRYEQQANSVSAALIEMESMESQLTAPGVLAADIYDQLERLRGFVKTLTQARLTPIQGDQVTVLGLEFARVGLDVVIKELDLAAANCLTIEPSPVAAEVAASS